MVSPNMVEGVWCPQVLMESRGRFTRGKHLLFENVSVWETGREPLARKSHRDSPENIFFGSDEQPGLMVYLPEDRNIGDDGDGFDQRQHIAICGA